MATHEVKPDTIAQLWDKPEEPRANKGQLQAGTDVTVSQTRDVNGVSFAQLSSHNGWWTKTGWLTALAATPPPTPAPATELPAELRGFDAAGNPIAEAVWKLQ
jgi:hypothetical protein